MRLFPGGEGVARGGGCVVVCEIVDVVEDDEMMEVVEEDMVARYLE